MSTTFGEHTIEVFNANVCIVNEPHAAVEHFVTARSEQQLADEAEESGRYAPARTLDAIAMVCGLFDAARALPEAPALGRLLAADHGAKSNPAWIMVVEPEHKIIVQEFVSVDAAYVGAASALARDAEIVMELYDIDPRQHSAQPLGTFRRACS